MDFGGYCYNGEVPKNAQKHEKNAGLNTHVMNSALNKKLPDLTTCQSLSESHVMLDVPGRK